MRVPIGPGVYSFYWIARGKNGTYGPGEIDIEFVTAGTLGNADKWDEDEGYVWFAVHPNDALHEHTLGFNPTADFHRYGFLWTPDQVTWTVDGNPVYTDVRVPSELSGPRIETGTPGGPDHGSIVMNAWIGNENWGGKMPPSEEKTAVYDYVWHIPGATRIPKTGPRQ
jgi:beta-glucanase (GH16 family)